MSIFIRTMRLLDYEARDTLKCGRPKLRCWREDPGFTLSVILVQRRPLFQEKCSGQKFLEGYSVEKELSKKNWREICARGRSYESCGRQSRFSAEEADQNGGIDYSQKLIDNKSWKVLGWQRFAIVRGDKRRKATFKRRCREKIREEAKKTAETRHWAQNII